MVNFKEDSIGELPSLPEIRKNSEIRKLSGEECILCDVFMVIMSLILQSLLVSLTSNTSATWEHGICGVCRFGDVDCVCMLSCRWFW